jgi:hypothetical protein
VRVRVDWPHRRTFLIRDRSAEPPRRAANIGGLDGGVKGKVVSVAEATVHLRPAEARAHHSRDLPRCRVISPTMMKCEEVVARFATAPVTGTTPAASPLPCSAPAAAAVSGFSLDTGGRLEY